jgi:DNA-binding GntR family transcriptional regulator
MQKERVAMVDALRAGDVAALETLLRDSIDGARAELVASMGEGPITRLLPD